MITHDPLLKQLAILSVRFFLWIFFVSVFAAVLWYAVWERLLGYSGSVAYEQLIRFLTRHADPYTDVLGLLTIATTALGISLLWALSASISNSRKELRVAHIRGSRLGGVSK